MQVNKQSGRALLLVLLAALCTISLSASEIVVAEPKTGKERLSDKSSDEQRVDNCGVPPERRGSKPRPDCRKGLADEDPDPVRNFPGKSVRSGVQDIHETRAQNRERLLLT